MLLKENKQILLVLNKLDKLVLELKLPPTDAYFKIKHTLDEINIVVQKFRCFLSDRNTAKKVYFSPLHGNTLFASTEFGCIFSLETFAQIYLERQKMALNFKHSNQRHGASVRNTKNLIEVEKLSKFLWGDIYYNTATRKF